MRVTGLPAPPVRWITGLRLRPGVRREGPRQGQRPALTPAPPRSSTGRFGNAVPAPTHADNTFAACTYTADHPRRLRCPAVNVLTRSGAAYTERDNLGTLRTVTQTSAQRAESAIWRGGPRPLVTARHRALWRSALR